MSYSLRFTICHKNEEVFEKERNKSGTTFEVERADIKQSHNSRNHVDKKYPNNILRRICLPVIKSQGSTPIRLRQFGLHFDEHKVIRCKGRLENISLPDSSKNPVLLPSKHRFVDLLIRRVHKCMKQRNQRCPHYTERKVLDSTRSTVPINACFRFTNRTDV